MGAMPALSHPKYEAYAIHRAGGCSKTEAAKRAGFPPRSAHNEGCRVEKRPEVSARVAELMAVHESQGDESPESLSTKLVSFSRVVTEVVSLQRKAEEKFQYSVALGCLQYLGKLGRLTPDTAPAPAGPRTLNQFNISTMTAKDLGDYLRGQVQSLPAAERKALESVIDIEAVSSEDSIDDLL